LDKMVIYGKNDRVGCKKTGGAKEMPIFQKAGFTLSAVTFICLGLIFIILGLKYENTVLKYMGYFWIPAGLLQLTIVMYLLYKKMK